MTAQSPYHLIILAAPESGGPAVTPRATPVAREGGGFLSIVSRANSATIRHPAAGGVLFYVHDPLESGPLQGCEPLIAVHSPVAMSIPPKLAGSHVYADVAATNDTTLALSNAGTIYGTATFPAGASVASLRCVPFSVNAGDLLAWTGPASPDATLAGIRIAMTGTRV